MVGFEFWINPVYENAEGNPESKNYTVKFTNKSPNKNSSVYLIITLIAFLLGLVIVISVTASKFSHIYRLEQKYKKLCLEYKTSDGDESKRNPGSAEESSQYSTNVNRFKCSLIRMASCESSPKKPDEKEAIDQNARDQEAIDYASISLNENLVFRATEYDLNISTSKAESSTKTHNGLFSHHRGRNTNVETTVYRRPPTYHP